MDQMDATLRLLRESGKARDAEFSMQACKDNREYNSRIGEVQKLSDFNQQYHETFGKNLHIITSHKHAISKVVNEAKQLDGLPIRNEYHKQTLDFMNDAATFINNAKNVYTKPDEQDNLQNNGSKLSESVQAFVQSASDVFVATKSSVDNLEMLMENLDSILQTQDDDGKNLERSIFDE